MRSHERADFHNLALQLPNLVRTPKDRLELHSWAKSRQEGILELHFVLAKPQCGQWIKLDVAHLGVVEPFIEAIHPRHVSPRQRSTAAWSSSRFDVFLAPDRDGQWMFAWCCELCEPFGRVKTCGSYKHRSSLGRRKKQNITREVWAKTSPRPKNSVVTELKILTSVRFPFAL